MSVNNVIGDLTQALNCKGKCDCCSQSQVQQQQLSNQINDLARRVAKIEQYINKLDEDLINAGSKFREMGDIFEKIFQIFKGLK
jgi:cell division protein FtsB